MSDCPEKVIEIKPAEEEVKVEEKEECCQQEAAPAQEVQDCPNEEPKPEE